MEHGHIIIFKIGWKQTATSRYNFMLIYAFKMAVTIAFLNKNALEVI